MSILATQQNYHRNNSTGETEQERDSQKTSCCTRLHCSSTSWQIPLIHGVLQSKKATLVLLWSTAVHLFYILFLVTPDKLSEDNQFYKSNFLSGIIFGVLLLLYPLSGWIADVYFTRFRTLYAGLWLVVAGSLVATVVRFFNLDVALVGLAIAAVGQALFEVNAIQFGLDQLQTYSTDNHRYFIYWFYFTMELGHFIYGLCYCGARQVQGGRSSSDITGAVFSTVQITLLILIGIQACLWRKKFYHHPTGFHPFKQIMQILNYSRKKRPSAHPTSAFQYTDEEVPMCLDRAKYKYGGPFTTEQVEDVKVFFYILFILVPLSSIYYVDEIHNVAREFQTNDTWTEPVSYGECLLLEVPNWIRSFVAVTLLPLYILVISRLINRITHHSLLLWRLGLALVLTFFGIVVLFGIQLKVAIHQIQDINNNTNAMTTDSNSLQQCFAGDIIDYQWLALPEIINSLSYVIVFSTTLEFICAQSPYSTKGLLIGIWFSFQGLDTIIVSLQQIFTLDCYFGYYIAKGLILIGFIIMYGFSAKIYQYRRRQDKDVRTIIENYYTARGRLDAYEEDEESNKSNQSWSMINDSLAQGIMSYNTVQVMQYQ